MRGIKAITVLVLLTTPLLLASRCSVSLDGKSIPAEMKTINVGFFENTAALVVPTLSQSFTEALKDRIRTTTRLSMVNSPSEANARISGTITDYHSAPISIQATNNNTAPIAGASALYITVKVKFEYDADKKLNFEQSFTKSLNYNGDLIAQEPTLIQAITKQIIDDVFNKAFNNW